MRPRVIPAEDVRRAVGPGLVGGRASMRPRVIPAEDTLARRLCATRQEASMRPRVIPAEDQRDGVARGAQQQASMRPRVIPAEDDIMKKKIVELHRGFNEAAGNPRGRLVSMLYPIDSMPRASMRPRVIPAEDGDVLGQYFAAVQASMRPRVIPAEDRRGRISVERVKPGFNEAAGNPRGRPQRRRDQRVRSRLQ